MNCNIRFLAKEANCSPATVSRVLNNFPYVKPEIRSRVIAAAKKYNYSLSRNCFLVIIPNSANFLGYLGHILKHLLEEATRRNYHLTITSEENLSFSNGTFLYDGVISIPSTKGLERRWGENEVLPMICLNSQGKAEDNILCVSSDNRQGIFMALDHFKAYGHRNIAYVTIDNRTPENTTDIEERERFYKEWMKKYNPGIKPEILNISIDNINREHYWNQNLQALLQKGITALLIPGESTSVYLYRWLNKMGLQIPQDVSVIGMEHEVLSSSMTPPETTIMQDWEKLASAAFDTLENMIKKSEIQHTVIPYKLINRNSVANLNEEKK